jgi:predicted metal-dependent peptidase
MATVRPQSAKELEALISATRLRLRMHAPFFAALAMFAEVRFSDAVEIAATDGRTLWLHPNRYADLPAAQRDAVFLHELLHAALLHPLRRGMREPETFNIAADIVVNGMVATEEHLQLPDGAIRDSKLELLSVEEIYELLQKQPLSKRPRLPLADLLKPGSISPTDDGKDAPTAGKQPSSKACHRGDLGEDAASGKREIQSQHDHQDLEAHWKQAIQQACLLAQSQGKGELPAGLQRHLDEIVDPELDWRSQLWRYLVRTPHDYSGFDRRFLHQGLYIDHLESESVEVYCCIDTSGSVSEEQLSLFLAELTGILLAYPLLCCWLFYADARCYGPYQLQIDGNIPVPQGGGGTDFRPFFKRVDKYWNREKQAVCVYLTDGYGDFPSREPELSTLWVVVPGGLEDGEFPWGEVLRLQGCG